MKNEATKQALIVLPQPEILQPRVDHDRTKTWEVRRMVWLPWNADQDQLRDEVMRQAQTQRRQRYPSEPDVWNQFASASVVAVWGLLSTLAGVILLAVSLPRLLQ